MQIQENISLAPFNTFRIHTKARWFAPFSKVEELNEILSSSRAERVFVLGGGSNILFTEDFPGLVLKNEVMGIEKVDEDPENVFVRAGAGVNWHRLVLTCIENNWAGVENLSLIPGCVGASPMQNIGAYGVELSETFHELKAFHIREKANYTFKLKDCGFGYRDSVFKNKYRNEFVILTVTLKLAKTPRFHTSYGTLKQELDRMGVKELSIRAISDAVIRIRSSKLPDPKDIGNAGSYFKNPTITKEKFNQLKSDFPGIVGYENANGSIKLAAGWLIEHCGPAQGISWKGLRRGDAGCHEKQALVLVNFGNASGKEIYELGEEIKTSVKKKFDVDLEREVNII